jgi:hypothetical protein
LAAAGCATASLDRSESRGSPAAAIQVADVPVRGFTVRVRRAGDGEALEGELLAVDAAAIHLSNGYQGPGQVISVPIRQVEAVEVRDVFASGALGLAIWTGLGALSTLSHGLALVLTAPVWLLIGIPVSIGAAVGNDLAVRPAEIPALYQFARFPAGLPPDWRSGTIAD